MGKFEKYELNAMITNEFYLVILSEIRNRFNIERRHPIILVENLS